MFRLDCTRMIAAGIIEAAATTFALLIAVRHLQAGAVGKALVASGNSVGLLLSPFLLHLAIRSGRTPVWTACRALLVGGVAFLAAAAAPSAAWYIPAAVLGLAMNSTVIPLLTHVYHDNYPPHQRGKLYARAYMLRIGAALATGALGGRWLDAHPGANGTLLLIFAGAFGLAAWAVSQMRATPLPVATDRNPLAAFRFVRHDRLFRQTLIMWMLMGFANLMMLPLRIEYLGNPRHGLARTATEIAILTAVIPNLARLAMNPVWGWLFDRVNFFALRVAVNLGFALGIAAFFTSTTETGLLTGAVVYGVSTAGGDVAWGLWVTKFAPPNRVADYMSVHTALTGVRGVIAPMAAFQLIQRFSLAGLGWFSAGLIVVATVMLIPELVRPLPPPAGEFRSPSPSDPAGV